MQPRTHLKKFSYFHFKKVNSSKHGFKLTPSNSFFLSSYDLVSTRRSYLEATWIFGCRREMSCLLQTRLSSQIGNTYWIFSGEGFRVQTLLQGFVPQLLLLSFFQFFQLKEKSVFRV